MAKVNGMGKGIKRSKRGGKGIAIGVGISFGLMVMLTAFLATLADRQILSYEAAAKLPRGIVLICGAAGAFIAGKMAEEKRLIVCLLTGGGYLLTLFAVTALFFHGQFQGVLAVALMVLAAAAVAGMLVGNHGRRKKRTRYKIG